MDIYHIVVLHSELADCMYLDAIIAGFIPFFSVTYISYINAKKQTLKNGFALLKK